MSGVTILATGWGVPLAIGQTIGRHRIEEQIGAGGMGVVFRAYDEKLERDLAMKVLSPGTLDDAPASAFAMKRVFCRA